AGGRIPPRPRPSRRGPPATRVGSGTRSRYRPGRSPSGGYPSGRAAKLSAPMGVINHLMQSLAGWPALAIVFLVPALEASIFVGFVFPGETAVVLGGVLAGQGYIPIWAVVIVAIIGAIIGDSVGFMVGARWGEWLVDRTVGRVVKIAHIDRARHYVARKGGVAVFLGRWPAVLRALVPATAGVSGMTYRTFFPWNVAGGAVWATTFALLGWGAATAGGASCTGPTPWGS